MRDSLRRGGVGDGLTAIAVHVLPGQYVTTAPKLGLIANSSPGACGFRQAPILLAMAAAGVSAQEVDRDWWDCPALPDDLVGIAVVSEDWDGVRWYENPAERDPDTGPLWRRCVPLNPPVVAESSQDGEDEPATRWLAWAADEAYCEDVSFSTGIGDYRDPATAVLFTEGSWNLCSFQSFMRYYPHELSCQAMGWQAPDAAGFMDADDPRIAYLQFPYGAEYSLICATSRDPDEAAPWAVYLVPGLAGGTPPMTMPGAD